MNKTLMEKSRSMLSGVELGQEYWAKAAGYNMLPSQSITFINGG
jgi:hypothetical protein